MRPGPSEVEEHQIGEIEYLLQYKRIRRMYLRLKPQESKKQEQMAPKPVRQYVTGEEVYVWGKAYELLVLTDPEMVRQLCGEEAADALLKHHMASVKLENAKLLLACPSGFDEAKREQCIDLWLKRQMEAFLPAIFQGCRSLVGKQESSWYVRKMKTRWGTCNIRTGRICINLNLGHLPPEYLSYIVIHELTHLWEKGHGEQFKARMDQYYPQWRERRQDIIKLAYML